MDMAPQPFTAGARATLSNAKQAYLEGDFERCLDICSAIRIGSIATASEVALLTARALLRTGRPREAQDAIVDALEAHATLDASLTAQLLVATARIRQADADTGIAILLNAASRSSGAHLAVRSEIAFATALGYWEKREIETAQAYLERVDPRSDIVHARALELEAWCHAARRDYRRSAQAFRATLVRLDGCAVRDRTLAATAISSLSMYAAELFDPDLARFVDARAQSAEWPADLAIHHYLTLAHQALFCEFAGNPLAAYQFASRAREVAPTAVFAVFGWALCSAIARNAGETISSIVFAKRAQSLLETLDARELSGEERFSLLCTAEACVHFDPEYAIDVFARYWGPAPIDVAVASSIDPRITADETYIAAVIARAKGENERARSCYLKAFELFREIGYVRRAVLAAHGLLAFGNDEARAYIATQLAGTTNHITKPLCTSPATSSDRLAGLASRRHHRARRRKSPAG